MSNNIWIDKATVLPMTEPAGAKELYFEGGVGIMGDRIVAVGRDDEAKQRFVERCGGDCHVIDGRGKLLMPGLINTHCHVAMTLMRGYADDIPLMKWLYGRIWPYESNLDRNDVRLGAELGIVEMLKGGVTTFVDMYWYEEAVADAVRDMGIRAVLAPSFSDARMAEAEIDLPATIEKAAGCDRMSVMIAPHAAYSCSPENLRRMVALRDKYGIPVTIHLAETLNEQQTIEQQFGCSPVKYIDSYGLLAEGTIAAHCVHLNDEDHEILCRRKVSVAHNPQSNMKISSGIAPVARMVEEGINVCVATDGPCSNNDLDMWDEMRSASMLQKVATGDPCVLPAYEVLRMSTVNAARAIGRGDELGQVREGMLADLIMLDIEKPHLYPRYDMVANLVYSAKSTDVDTVIVGGRVLVEKGMVKGVDEMELCHRAERRAFEVAEKV